MSLHENKQTADYESARRPDHSTLGDSMERLHRDPDAFTAGAQHALDRMLNEADRMFVAPITLEILDRLAASVLNAVHDLPRVPASSAEGDR